MADASEYTVDQWIAIAEQSARNGQQAESVNAFDRALALAPAHPRALNGRGNRALAAGDALSAASFLRRAAQADPTATIIWLNLAAAHRLSGSAADELAALEKALAIDPYLVPALAQKAEWHDRRGEVDQATRTYRALVATVPDNGALPPQLAGVLARGRELIEQHDTNVADALEEALGDFGDLPERFRHCAEILTGQRKVYLQQPVGLTFPYLPHIQFFDRKCCPWFDVLERDWLPIRDEALAAGDAGGVPYVRIGAGQPVNQWAGLNHSLNWTAIFLHKDGREQAGARERFPATMHVIDQLPLLDIEGRGPTVMFSILKPRTRIPPHNGVTNTRAVVHLPLVVPDDCGFRVGSDTRDWREGEAWAFDDTIEHEAWNDSDLPRVILIADTWNPYLSEDERDLLRKTDRVLQSIGASATGGF